MNSPVTLLPEAGQIAVGALRFDGRLGAGGAWLIEDVCVRPLTVRERNQAVLHAGRGRDRAGRLARLVADVAASPLAAGRCPSDARLGLAIECVALHLAGASANGSLDAGALHMARVFGRPLDEVLEVPGIEADRFVDSPSAIESVASTGSTSSGGWTTLEFEPATRHDSGSLAAIRERLASALATRADLAATEADAAQIDATRCLTEFPTPTEIDRWGVVRDDGVLGATHRSAVRADEASVRERDAYDAIESDRERPGRDEVATDRDLGHHLIDIPGSGRRPARAPCGLTEGCALRDGEAERDSVESVAMARSALPPVDEAPGRWHRVGPTTTGRGASTDAIESPARADRSAAVVARAPFIDSGPRDTAESGDGSLPEIEARQQSLAAPFRPRDEMSPLAHRREARDLHARWGAALMDLDDLDTSVAIARDLHRVADRRGVRR